MELGAHKIRGDSPHSTLPSDTNCRVHGAQNQPQFGDSLEGLNSLKPVMLVAIVYYSERTQIEIGQEKRPWAESQRVQGSVVLPAPANDRTARVSQSELSQDAAFCDPRSLLPEAAYPRS